MKFCNNTNFTLPKQSQRSRSVLQDRSRSLGLFWKENSPSYNRRNMVSFIYFIYSHLAMKQVQDAAKLLARRYDQSSLKTAAHISMIANDKQQGLMYTQKVVQQHLLQYEWKDTYSYLKEQKGLQVQDSHWWLRGSGPSCSKLRTTVVNKALRF